MTSISLSITFLSYVHCSNIHSSAAYWVFVSQLIAFRMNRQPFNKQADKTRLSTVSIEVSYLYVLLSTQRIYQQKQSSAGWHAD